MNLLAGDPAPTDPARLRLELGRCTNRLRSLPLARLSAPSAEGSRARLAARVAQRLVDLTATLQGPPARQLPLLPDHAAADVLAVVGHDLLAAVGERAARRPGMSGETEPVDVAEIIQEAVSALIELRSGL